MVTQQARPRARGATTGRLLRVIGVVASIGLLAYMLIGVAYQMLVPPPASRILLIRDVPLPTVLGDGGLHPLAPGVEVDFDHFDFQALDPQTHLLFIAHTGPNPDFLAPEHITSAPGTREHIPVTPQSDGHIVVFDTQTGKVVGRVNVPQVAGVVVAADLAKVYAADAMDGIVYALDEHTLAAKPIPLGDLESPDGISYDPVDHRVFVSDPGAPANPDDPDHPNFIDPKNQNLAVIDALKDTLITKINLGSLPKLSNEHAAPLDKPAVAPTFGYDVGHNRYDEALHRVFVATQILADPDSSDPTLLPPAGTGELMAIDAVTNRVVGRLVLPPTCSTPHGLTIDERQGVAFIACVDAGGSLLANLVRVRLTATGMSTIPADPKTMQLAPTPDIVVLDHAAQVLFVGCRGGISVFDERAGHFRKLGDYRVGANTHTIAIDEQTQDLFLPINAGGRPVLRIAWYNPRGA